jgi:RimJ/RimL family protein N-acetyltransferase
VRRAEIRDGSPVDIRPIAPGDKDLLREGFERLSERSRYERFLSPIDRLGPGMLRYFTEVDHHDHEALIAIDPETGHLVGVARYVREANNPHVAEAAITVADEWQGRGLGTLLLDAVAERAREEDIHRFSAYVLARNEDMLDMLRRLGPTTVRGRHHGAIEVEAELPRAGIGEQLRDLLRLAARLTRKRPELDSNQRPTP